MGTASTVNRWAYEGDGATLPFAYENRIYAATDLKVYVDGALVTTGYSVSGVGEAAGGLVTFAAAPAAPATAGVENVVIEAAVPATQNAVIPTAGAYAAAATEAALDRLTRELHFVLARLARVPQLDPADPDDFTAFLPFKADRASLPAFFDADGNLTALAGVFDADDLAASVFGAGLIQAANAAAARTLLAAVAESDAIDWTGIHSHTKRVSWAKGADVASANALTLGDDGNTFDITGTTAITSIATKGVGTVVKLHFDAALTLTHHATDLVLPGAANITTAAGDEAEFVEYATGDWRCTAYSKASGEAVTANPGKIAQVVTAAYATYSSHTTAIPKDDTIPQQTEGEQILSLAITPTDASSTLLVLVSGAVITPSSPAIATAALFLDSGADAIAAQPIEHTSAYSTNFCLQHARTAGGTSAQTFKVRVGPSSGTLYVNGTTSARLFGGVDAVTITILEILP